METIRVVFLLGNIGHETKFFCVELAETVCQTFTWSRIDAEMIAVLVAPCIGMSLQRLHDF